MTQFVLVHGTTQSPAGWDRLAGELRGRGHGVAAIDLPAGHPDWSPADYARHAAGQATTTGDRPVGVGHSGAGVLLPAIATEIGAGTAVWLGVDPTSDPELALRFLFHDSDPEARQWALGTLRLFDPGPAVCQHSPVSQPQALARILTAVPTGQG
jgi:hypothetical protein